MLTIFSIPKPFIGHNSIIQRNAIQSWLWLEPRCEIFLCGDDPGVAEVAEEFDVQHLPDIEKNEFGTPLLSSAFQLVQQKAGGSFVCYVNADIILLNNVLNAVQLVKFPRFLLLGQRWNLNVTVPIDFQNSFWEKDLRERVATQGQLQPPFGSDYFIFPKEIQWGFPRFAVGRPFWDNWMIYRARALSIPVIDATEMGTAIHQNHNYAHIPKGVSQMSYDGPEAVQNRELIGGEEYSFNLRDATYQIKRSSVQKAMSFSHLQYRLKRQPVLNLHVNPCHAFLLRLLSALLYRRQYFPDWFWQNLIYATTK